MTSRMAEKSSVPDVLVFSGPRVLRSEQVTPSSLLPTVARVRASGTRPS